MRAILHALGAFLSLFAPAAKKTALVAWEDHINPPATTYTVFKGPGVCTDLPIMVKLAGPLSAKTYEDQDIKPNRQYCYTVTATFEGIESSASDPVTITVSMGPTKHRRIDKRQLKYTP